MCRWLIFFVYEIISNIFEIAHKSIWVQQVQIAQVYKHFEY